MNRRFETILAQNARIAQVLRQAKADLDASGKPACFTVPGCDFKDVTTALDDMTPLTDAPAQRKIQDYADEKDAEDARDTMATRADFMRDLELTE